MQHSNIYEVAGLCQTTTPEGQAADMGNVPDPIQIFYQTLEGSGK